MLRAVAAAGHDFFCTDATIDRAEAGRRLERRAYDWQKRLQGIRLVEGRLLGVLRPRPLLEAPTHSESAPEQPAT